MKLFSLEGLKMSRVVSKLSPLFKASHGKLFSNWQILRSTECLQKLLLLFSVAPHMNVGVLVLQVRFLELFNVKF